MAAKKKRERRELTTDEIDLIIIKASDQARKEHPLPPSPKSVEDLTLRTVFGDPTDDETADPPCVVTKEPTDDTEPREG